VDGERAPLAIVELIFAWLIPDEKSDRVMRRGAEAGRGAESGCVAAMGLGDRHESMGKDDVRC
jgi:hypothetical protein